GVVIGMRTSERGWGTTSPFVCRPFGSVTSDASTENTRPLNTMGMVGSGLLIADCRLQIVDFTLIVDCRFIAGLGSAIRQSTNPPIHQSTNPPIHQSISNQQSAISN